MRMVKGFAIALVLWALVAALFVAAGLGLLKASLAAAFFLVVIVIMS